MSERLGNHPAREVEWSAKVLVRDGLAGYKLATTLCIIDLFVSLHRSYYEAWEYVWIAVEYMDPCSINGILSNFTQFIERE